MLLVSIKHFLLQLLVNEKCWWNFFFIYFYFGSSVTLAIFIGLRSSFFRGILFKPPFQSSFKYVHSFSNFTSSGDCGLFFRLVLELSSFQLFFRNNFDFTENYELARPSVPASHSLLLPGDDFDWSRPTDYFRGNLNCKIV